MPLDECAHARAGNAHHQTAPETVMRDHTTTAATPAEPVATSADLLLRAGFKPLDDSTEHELSRTLRAEAGLYAFLIDGEVRHVGLSGRSPRRRVDHHRRRSVQARTHARVKAMFQAAIAAGAPVAVLIAADELQTKDGLPAGGATGLEAGLILLLRPKWAARGTL